MATQGRAICNDKLKAGWGYALPPGESSDYFPAWVATLVRGLADWAGDDISEPSRLVDRLTAGERPELDVKSMPGAPMRLVLPSALPSSADAIRAIEAALGLPEGGPTNDVWVATLDLLENVERCLEPGPATYLDALVGQADSKQADDERRSAGSASPSQIPSVGNPTTVRSAQESQREEHQAPERSSAERADCANVTRGGQSAVRSDDELEALRSEVGRLAAAFSNERKSFASEIRKLKSSWASSAEELSGHLSALSDNSGVQAATIGDVERRVLALQRSSDEMMAEHRASAAAVRQAFEAGFNKWAKHAAELDQRIETIEGVLGNRIEVRHLERYEVVRKTIESMVADRVRREMAHALKTLLVQLQHAATKEDLDSVHLLAAELNKKIVALGLR